MVALAAAALLAGCSGTPEIVENIKEGNYLQKPVFSTPDWARARPRGSVSLGPSGPVAPEDLVDAGGHCAPEAPQAAPQAAAAPAEPAPATEATAATPATPDTPAPPAGAAAYGSVAGDLASAPMPQGPAPKPKPMPARVKTASAAPDAGLDRLQPEGGAGTSGAPLLGGIALGMTECQAVRRGGQPSNISIGAGTKGERKVVITYLGGTWPGIYTFESGRLKQVDAAPVPERPKGKPKRKPKKPPAKTARGNATYVQ
jgi:hypothetical protein